jgi:hypothetical protein
VGGLACAGQGTARLGIAAVIVGFLGFIVLLMGRVGAWWFRG